MNAGVSNARLLITLGLLILITMAPHALGQNYMSYEEAENLFERLNCTSCHNGQVAEEFEEVVLELAEWGEEYDSIDEAVREKVVYFNNQRFNSYDELIEQMSSNVGKSPDDPEIQKMFEWFEAVFEGKVDVPAGEAPPEGAEGGEEGAETGTNIYYLGIAALVVVVLALLLLRKR